MCLYKMYDKYFHKPLISQIFIDNIKMFSVFMYYTYFKFLYYLILPIEQYNLKIFFGGWDEEIAKGEGEKNTSSYILTIKVRVPIKIFTNTPLLKAKHRVRQKIDSV